MVKTFQRFNNRIGAWVKIRQLKSGKTRILNVKEANPTRKFKGVPVTLKRRKK